MIGWYKFYHYGRSNFCNKQEMTHKDLIEFFVLLRNQLLEEPDEPYPVKKETYIEPSVTVTETDRSCSDIKDSEGIKHRFEKEIDIQKLAERIAINSIYGYFPVNMMI